MKNRTLLAVLVLVPLCFVVWVTFPCYECVYESTSPDAVYSMKVFRRFQKIDIVVGQGSSNPGYIEVYKNGRVFRRIHVLKARHGSEARWEPDELVIPGEYESISLLPR